MSKPLVLACLGGLALLSGARFLFLLFEIGVRRHVLPRHLSKAQLKQYDRDSSRGSPVNVDVWVGGVVALAILIAATLVCTTPPRVF